MPASPVVFRRLRTPARLRSALVAGAVLLLGGCGGGTQLITEPGPVIGVQSKTPQAGQKLGFPALATKNTTRVGGADPVADAAGVALATYPSTGQGAHPQAVAVVSTDSWQGALAASELMAAPIRAPVLLSGPDGVPSATSDALRLLSPTGSGSLAGAQVIRIGDARLPSGYRKATISGSDPFALAAAIDRFTAAARGRASVNVVVASADDPAYAMPAAGWAAESGEPLLFVNGSGVPSATKQALLAHQHAKIYVLGPSCVVPDSVLHDLSHYGSVKRVSGSNPVTNAVAFATYRDPPCATGQPCAHVPGSFGWAMRSPGHGYVLLNANRPLDAAASAPLSASGDFGPQLVIDNPSTLPSPVLNFFLDYATPGYTQEGPTAAVYNHGWVIGDTKTISVQVQAQMDSLLEVVPQK